MKNLLNKSIPIYSKKNKLSLKDRIVYKALNFLGYEVTNSFLFEISQYDFFDNKNLIKDAIKEYERFYGETPDAVIVGRDTWLSMTKSLGDKAVYESLYEFARESGIIYLSDKIIKDKYLIYMPHIDGVFCTELNKIPFFNE